MACGSILGMRRCKIVTGTLQPPNSTPPRPNCPSRTLPLTAPLALLLVSIRLAPITPAFRTRLPNARKFTFPAIPYYVVREIESSDMADHQLASFHGSPNSESHFAPLPARIIAGAAASNTRASSSSFSAVPNCGVGYFADSSTLHRHSTPFCPTSNRKSNDASPSQLPRTKNQEPRTKNQEPRTKNQEPRTKNQEPRTMSAVFSR